MSKMGLYDTFELLQHKFWQKERLGVKLQKFWNRFDPSACKWSATHHWKAQGKLQVFFRPCPNRRSEQRVMPSQSV